MKDQKDIAKESFGKFIPPEHYFAELEQELFLKGQLKGNDEQSFQVPHGYFEKLSQSISTAKSITPVVPLWKKDLFKLAWAGAAAAILIFLTLDTPTKEKCESFACLMEQTDLTPEDLAWVETSIIEEVYSESDEASEFAEEESAYINYLLEQDVNLELILEEEL